MYPPNECGRRLRNLHGQLVEAEESSDESVQQEGDRRHPGEALFVVLGWSGVAQAQDPVAGDFQKVTLDENTQNPMELDVAPDGRVFYIERDGRLMIWKPTTQQTVTAGTVPVTTSQENGLLGLQLAPDFAFSQWVYLFYSQLPDSTNTQIIARFKMNGDTLDLSSEQRILTFQHQRRSAATRPARCTSVQTAACTSPRATTRTRSTRAASTRSTSAPAASLGRAAHARATRTTSTARSCGSSRWRSRSARPASARRTRSPPATCSTRPPTRQQTRPEIFAMGFRNPFRFTVDPETGWVLMGDYGPDASSTNANRGPQGSVEYNVITSGQLWLALLHPRQHAVQRLQLRDLDVGRQVRLRRAGQRLAQQHGPHDPSARPSARPPGWASPIRTRASRRPRHRRRPDGRPALPLRPDARLVAQVPGVLRRQVVHRRVEQRLDQDRQPERHRRDDRRAELRARHRLPAPDGPRLRPRRRALRDRVGLRASTATTPTPASTGSTTSRATRTRSRRRGDADRGPRAAGRDLLERGLQRPRGHARHVRVGLRRRRAHRPPPTRRTPSPTTASTRSSSPSPTRAA